MSNCLRLIKPHKDCIIKVLNVSVILFEETKAGLQWKGDKLDTTRESGPLNNTH